MIHGGLGGPIPSRFVRQIGFYMRLGLERICDGWAKMEKAGRALLWLCDQLVRSGSLVQTDI